jgi:alpha/beta superfamily hydrolase
MAIELQKCDQGLKNFPVDIPGPAGNLEAMVDCAAAGKRSGAAVVCHPHPLYGGTMQNKVVHTLARSLSSNGLDTLRFNFRGVGNSDGEYDAGSGETDDARAVFNWLQQQRMESSIVLAGFSFGSFVALKAAAVLDPLALITVAPPVRMFDFDKLSSIDCPWLLVQGADDEIVDVNAVMSWVDKLKNPPMVKVLPDCSHFFHGKLVELRSACDEFIQSI